MTLSRLFRIFFFAIVLPVGALWGLYQYNYVRHYDFKVDENTSVNVVAKDCVTCFTVKTVKTAIEIKKGDKELVFDFKSVGPVVEFLVDSSGGMLIENPPYHYILISLDSLQNGYDDHNSLDPVVKSKFRLLYRIDDSNLKLN